MDKSIKAFQKCGLTLRTNNLILSHLIYHGTHANPSPHRNPPTPSRNFLVPNNLPDRSLLRDLNRVFDFPRFFPPYWLHPFGPYLPCWQIVTSYRWVLSIVSRGYMIEFGDLPVTPWFIPTPPSPTRLVEVECLLQKNTIEKLYFLLHGHGFYSCYFTVPKQGGGLQPIMDLRNLKKVIPPIR